MARMTGARYLAEALEGYGVTHVFFVPTILSYALVEMEERTKITVDANPEPTVSPATSRVPAEANKANLAGNFIIHLFVI